MGKDSSSGMVEVISDIINRAPAYGIGSFKVIWNLGSTAIFRKKCLKEKNVSKFIKNMQ